VKYFYLFEEWRQFSSKEKKQAGAQHGHATSTTQACEVDSRQETYQLEYVDEDRPLTPSDIPWIVQQVVDSLSVPVGSRHSAGPSDLSWREIPCINELAEQNCDRVATHRAWDNVNKLSVREGVLNHKGSPSILPSQEAEHCNASTSSIQEGT